MKKNLFTACLLLLVLINACNHGEQKFREDIPIRTLIENERTGNRDIERQIDAWLQQMTLEEKTGQMLHITLVDAPGDTLPFVMHFDTTELIKYTDKYPFGFMINDLGLSAEQWYDFMSQLQEIYMRRSRLKIPYVYAICHQHGPSAFNDATIFPHNLTLAATFDTVHAFNCGEVTVLETADLGHNFIYVPVVDLGRDPRWARFYETFGESYVVCSAMGRAIVNGIQKNGEVLPLKAAACAKHFLGYSVPRSGWDRCPAHIPEQEIYELFAPSFQACIDAGVKIIEANSGEVNGIPVHASYEILTLLLRGKMGFKGVLNSDWGDVKKLVTYHKVAENEKEATFQALQAGLDCILTADDDLFAQYACELVREGRVPEERIDLSVRRILRLKYELGLFNGNFMVRNDRFDRINRQDSREKALNAARESIVLLKNSASLLPLDPHKTRKIVVVGPTAISRNALAGGWTVRWQAAGEQNIPERVQTLYQALTKEFPSSEVVFAPDHASLQKMANSADAIIYGAGEKPYAEFLGSISDMSLPDAQAWDIETAIATDVPVILVMISGRPLTITKIYDRLAAFIWAGLPGYEGGTAIAEIISGSVNPSGKLPFNYPYGPSRFINYNQKNHELMMSQVLDEPWAVAEFGDGLSYSSFSYGAIKLSDTLLENKNYSLVASLAVTNTGKTAGKEAVLWFICDEVGSITRPVKELKYFEKKEILPGEKKEYIFTIIPMRDLAFPDEKGKLLLEEGYFTLYAGDRQARFRLQL